jgi:hypothetical protein
MNISKAIGIVTAGIPIAGILIGGITFGLNFKSDVERTKEVLIEQHAFNISIEERFAGLDIESYDDSLLWLQTDTLIAQIDDIDIPEGYDDSDINTRLQELALGLTSLQVEVNGIEVGDTSDLQAQVSELSGQLSALSSMDMTSDDGTVDLGPLIVRIATVEGSMASVKSSIDSLKGDMRTVKSDITSLERKPSSSGDTKTIENRYDDSDLRSRISTVERQVNSLPTPSSGGGTTIQRVENPFDDASLRSDISSLQTAVAVLQASPEQSYDDSDLYDRINDIQWELNNLDIPTFTATDVSWLEDLMYDIKNELSMRIDELEWASDTTTTSDDMYAEKWLFEELQYEVMHIQEQVWELQTLIDASQTSSNNNTTSNNTTTTTTTSGRSWDGAWTEPYWIYVNHNEPSYTGDYWMDGYWDGYAVWINWECDSPGSQFEYCYIFKYNHASWVIQPLEPSNEWLANAYTDGEWPWSGTWNGAVNSVEVKGTN